MDDTRLLNKTDMEKYQWGKKDKVYGDAVISRSDTSGPDKILKRLTRMTEVIGKELIRYFGQKDFIALIVFRGCIKDSRSVVKKVRVETNPRLIGVCPR